MIRIQDDEVGSSGLDLEMIRKYSIPGPRYTSYPPATKFNASLEGLEDGITADNRDERQPLSLYFHLPFCQSLCWYCGCHTVITRDHSLSSKYVDDLANEVVLTALRIRRNRQVSQIHFGGGTPTFLAPNDLRRLGRIIKDQFELGPNLEFGVEIDPRTLTDEHVAALAEIGANRASLGVQDTNPKVQLAIHRWQPQTLNQRAMSALRTAGIRSVNVDLIFGLPEQTVSSFATTIDDVLALGPDRLSVFSYAHVPWLKPAQKIFDRNGCLPTAEEKLAMFAMAHCKLKAAGYIDIGLDHFARPGDELAIAQSKGTLHRNFQGYSTAADASLYGFGVSSISSTTRTYRQNFKAMDAWRSALESHKLPIERGLVLNPDDERRRAIIMRIMCSRKLDFAAASSELGVDVTSAFSVEIAGLRDLEDDGIVARTPTGFSVTAKGAPLLRVIAMRFDATFVSLDGQHSQTV